MPANNIMRPHALVTGASSGIGQAFAERLAQDGYDLIIVARRRDRLESLAQRLKENHHTNVAVMDTDLSKSDDLRALERRVAEGPALELLVNNAGFGAYMPFVQLDPDIAEDLIHVQVVAVMRLTRAALPGMLTRGHGTIINVSSRLAFSGPMGSTQLPKRATYAGTKSFVITFTQLLQSELEGTGIQVQALCPGVVRTEFHERVGMDPSRFPPQWIMKADDLVEASLTGLKLGEVICIPALEDADILNQLQEDQRRLFETSATGKVATRYNV
jgi:short-subunit dehydrogenase